MTWPLMIWFMAGGAVVGYTVAHYQFARRKPSNSSDPP